jgi:FixJ family two-component response regulator
MSHASRSSIASLLIAVVDDDSSFLRAVSRLLCSAGYNVAKFSSASDFLSALPTLSPHCLVLDIHMPEMTGLQLQEKITAEGFCAPVIFVTAYDTPQTRERAQKAGSFGLLLKPFDKELLLRAISVATGTPPSAASTL